jgi:RimJ/RimL family protein N-acetyltransferase
MAYIKRIVDSKGMTFVLKELGPNESSLLISMYDEFNPKAISQGLPPSNDASRTEWVLNLLKRGRNFGVLSEDTIVGHAALLPDEKRLDGEYIIFVLLPYRNRGLGTELTQATVAKAIELGLKNVWLTVESYNFHAIRVYRKAGFLFCDDGELERTMMLSL